MENKPQFSRGNQTEFNETNDDPFNKSSCMICSGRANLRTKSEMPSWCCVYNANIFKGYRPISLSWWETFRTIFWIHNETGNIWTHLAGVIMFYMLFQDLCHQPLWTNMSTMDSFVIWLYFFGLLICLLHSTLFHLFTSHSFDVNKILAKLDYCGISFFIGCSYAPWLYYGFYNSPNLQAIYLMLALFISILCGIFSLFDRFYRPDYHQIRAIMFFTDASLVIIPATHWCIRQIAYDPRPFLSLDHRPTLLLILQGVVYMIGALVYFFKFPESILQMPIFNLWFNSHQIFHISVVLGALIYYHSLILIMKMRLSNAACFYN